MRGGYQSCSGERINSNHAHLSGWLGAKWRVKLSDHLEDAAEDISLHWGPWGDLPAVRASVVAQGFRWGREASLKGCSDHGVEAGLS